MSRYQKSLRAKNAPPLYKNTPLRTCLLETIPNRFHEEFKTHVAIETDHPLLQKQIEMGWGFCGSISLAVSEILKLYDISCRVMKSRGMYGNQAAIDVFNQNLPMDELTRIIQDREDVYTLGFGIPPKNGQPDVASFHYVIEFTDSILDMTANQSERKEHHIYAKNFWVPKGERVPYLLNFGVEAHPPAKIHNNLELLPNVNGLLQWISDTIAHALHRHPIILSSDIIHQILARSA